MIQKIKLSRAEAGKLSGAIWIEYDDVTLDIVGVGYENDMSRELVINLKKNLEKIDNTLPQGNDKLAVNPAKMGKVIKVKDPETQEIVIDLPIDFEFRFNF
jgi:hypothetical protein